MCGRFVQITPIPKLLKRFKVKRLAPIEKGPSYNVAPAHQVLIINNEGERQMVQARWGLVPSWAKEASAGDHLFNVRAETIAQKPMFRHALKGQRCLIIADGFFAWKREGNRNLPRYILLSSGKVFAFAGLYNIWTSPAGATMYTCTIVTTEANEIVKPFHDRMPVMLPKSDEYLWLDPTIQDNEDLVPLLIPYDADEMETWEVTAEMNRPEHDSPENIKPV